MKRIRHSPEQIIRKLREADAELAKGAAIPEICKALGIAENTYYRWRNQFGGIKADAMKRLKESERRTPGSRPWSPNWPWTRRSSRRPPGETREPDPEARGRRPGDGLVPDLRASG